MDENPRRVMETSDAVIPQANYEANVDYVINEYMERLGTRLNILETELKYAWRALDLLSQEYIKMWERLEKLEGLLYEQQSVISQLLDFYTSGGGGVERAGTLLDGRLGELEVIREILGNGTVEDGLEEGLDVTDTETQEQTAAIQEMIEEMHIPDEAFYKSLNQAYREDLVGCEDNAQSNQLGLIWEEREETDENVDGKDGEEIYSSLDYKDYRGNSPCISDQDIAQLSRIDSIDHVAIEKLNELDRLSSKLQQDSANIKHLQRKLMESPLSLNGIAEETADNKDWSFSGGRNQEDLLILKSDLPNSLQYSSTRPSSRLSVTDSISGTDAEVAETLAGGIKTPTSPRRRTIEIATCSAPFTTVTGRLAYSAAVQHVESVEAAAAAALHTSKNPFYCNSTELNSLIAASFETVACTTPSVYSIKSEKAQSPTLSICSVRTRQDGYIGSLTPPPAPAPEIQSNQVFLGPPSATLNTSIGQEPGRLSPKVPHSPKSPRTSPKRHKSQPINIVPAKSDSGLSSMSGWSSLEKSPGSPKNGKPPNYSPLKFGHYLESDTDTLLQTSQGPFLPGGHHLSAFTTVKSPCSLETSEGYGTFVPAPAPVSDINVSPRRKPKQKPATTMFGEQTGIYSVAGSNNQTYTSVYTSNSADYINQTQNYFDENQKPTRDYAQSEAYPSLPHNYPDVPPNYPDLSQNYPDLIEPYEHNEFSSIQRQFSYDPMTTTTQSTAIAKRPVQRAHSASCTEGLANHEGYKTAMYRTMFPTGNITDALSYYPTSSRYDSNDAANAWADFIEQTQFDSTQSAETSPYHHYNQEQHQEQHQEQEAEHIYENQQQIDRYKSWNQRQEIPYLELDLRNRNVPEYIVQQQSDSKYYDPNGVIITQSGYITISSGAVSTTSNKTDKKKMRRGSTLKSAMTSVSHWLPDIHLPKRHRSYSLPGIGRQEDVERSKAFSKSNQRKKKKNPIVSTVSGIIQKAKRKAYSNHHVQSLSDPEQSEQEWGLKRANSIASEGGRSDDSGSVFSEQHEKENLFAKISGRRKGSRKFSQPEISKEKADQYQLELQQQQKQYREQQKLSRLTKGEIEEKEEQIPAHESDWGPNEQTWGENQGQQKQEERKPEDSKPPELEPFEQDLPLSPDLDLESLVKELDATSDMFPTVGDSKRGSTSSEKKEAPKPTRKPSLGKIHLEQSSFLETQQPTFEESFSIEEYTDESEPLKPEKLVEQVSTESHTDSLKAANDDAPPSEGSPSAISMRSHSNRFLPRHQQSLDIPGGHRPDEEDNRSTHSWRSTSRVSSRRQSTEDSIDSEDEWYCYELRKLEEMERQTQVEAEMGHTLQEEPELEEEPFEPAEEVKEKMSFVLRELRMKAKVVEGVLDAKDYNLQVVQSAKRRESNRESMQIEPNELFAKIACFKKESEEAEIFLSDVKEVEKEEEHSSGDTSGPDSPHLSTDEYEENEMAMNEDFARCYISKKDEADDKAPEEEVGVPRIQIQSPGIPLEDAKEAGPMGSKWKLLKALKERKAEEKCNQEKVADTPTEKEKVSMLGMMQKFYEIHVKT